MAGIPDWVQRLSVNDRGEVRANLANMIQALESAPEWAGLIRFDEMARVPVLGDRPFSDADGLEIATALQRQCMPNLNHRLVADAVMAVAHRNKFNPLKDHLSALVWNGEPHLDFWLTRYAGVDASDYASLVGRYWLLSAVARAFQPGVKADHCLILESAQGAGKSTLLRVLGREFFRDQLPAEITSKDASTALRGAWIVEISELRAARRAEADALKEFISRQVEKFRPPYGRFDVHEPRTSVFAGTTNEVSGYLRDTTGNRRFWPVRCGKIDLAAFERDRDQLLAEAVHEFRAGSEWYPTVAEQRGVFAPQQQERQEADPWADFLATALATTNTVTIPQAALLLEINTARMTPTDSRRIGRVLRELGFEQSKFVGKARARAFQRSSAPPSALPSAPRSDLPKSL